MLDETIISVNAQNYSFVPNWWGGQIANFAKKPPQVHLIIKRERPKSNTPILRNLDNFPSGAFYSTPTKIRHKRVELLVPHVNTVTKGQNSLAYLRSVLWNNLPLEIK